MLTGSLAAVRFNWDLDGTQTAPHAHLTTPEKEGADYQVTLELADRSGTNRRTEFTKEGTQLPKFLGDLGGRPTEQKP